MQKSVVVSSAEVMSSCGLVEAEIYDDGGNIAVQFNIEATSKLNRMFATTRVNWAGLSASNDNFSEKPVVIDTKPTEHGDKKTPMKSVSKEPQGWGANVFVEDVGVVRYYYGHRDSARKADASHAIGQAGRIS